MDYKEKVIALLNSQELSKEQKEKLEDIFPELAESEDERIRKEFKWKPITEIPTEHWANNYAISPLYLVKCGEKDGIAILGYSNYSFATKSWIDCCHATEPGIYRVTEWTDIKL